MEVTPTSRKGTLGTWWFRRSAGQSDAAPTMRLTYETELSFEQTTEVGAYADQRLNLAKLGRLKEERPRLRTGPGKSGRPGLSGGLGKRGHDGKVNPPRNRKGEAGNPPSTTGALEFYPNKRSAEEASKGSKMTPKPGFPPCPGSSMEGTYLLAMRGPAYRRHDSYPGFRTELENRVGDGKGKGTSG